mmetsp:Transcript_29255/g.86841  ORF Transcript_29255/g.86841 Transcript_29255/m.86841 type:complete len:221 (+) Transcript_29255:277-939(+)
MRSSCRRRPSRSRLPLSPVPVVFSRTCLTSAPPAGSTASRRRSRAPPRWGRWRRWRMPARWATRRPSRPSRSMSAGPRWCSSRSRCSSAWRRRFPLLTTRMPSVARWPRPSPSFASPTTRRRPPRASPPRPLPRATRCPRSSPGFSRRLCSRASRRRARWASRSSCACSATTPLRAGTARRSAPAWSSSPRSARTSAATCRPFLGSFARSSSRLWRPWCR